MVLYGEQEWIRWKFWWILKTWIGCNMGSKSGLGGSLGRFFTLV